MRRILVSLVVGVTIVAGLGGPAQAQPVEPPGAAWRVGGDTLTWTAPQRVTTADAVVEFYAGDRLLGRARSTDLRTFTVRLDGGERLTDLQVRAGGRRLDV